MALNIQNSCEIDDLIDEVLETSDQNHESVEQAFFKAGIYPEESKTFISWNDNKKMDSILVDFTMKDNPELKWLDEALVAIFKKYNINSIYITNSI